MKHKTYTILFDDIETELKFNKKGSFTITTEEYRNYLKNIVITHKESKLMIDNFEIVMSEYPYLETFIYRFLLTNNFYFLYMEENLDGSLEVFYKRLPKKVIKAIDGLKLVEARSDNDLRGLVLKSYTNHNLSFYFIGHGVSGSYVYDYQVAPSYVKAIEFEANYQTKWIKRTDYMVDYYHFSTNFFKIIDKNKYKPEGELIYMDKETGLSHSAGRTFDYLYNVTSSIKKGIDVNGVYINEDILYIDKIKIAKIVDFEPMKTINIKGHNTNTTRYKIKAMFDLLISKSDFIELFLNQFNENVNIQLHKLNIHSIKIFYNYGNDLSMDFGSGHKYLLRNKDMTFSEVDLQNFQKRMHNVSMIDYNSLLRGFSKEGNDVDYFYQENLYNFYTKNQELKDYINLSNLIKDNELDKVKKFIKGFKTPQNCDNIENLNIGYSPVDFIHYSVSEEMDEVLYEWILSEIKDGYVPFIDFDLSKYEDLANLLEEKGLRFNRFSYSFESI